MRSNTPWSLTISTDLHFLALARAFVESICQRAGFNDQITHAIVLATDEALNNVIRHAHQELPHAPIEIECYLATDGIEILLHDQGDPFDISQVPEMDPTELRIGGRGVFLMRKLMDELACYQRGDRGNTLRMVKRCPRLASGENS